MAEELTLSQMLDAHGVELPELADDELIDGVVVLFRVHMPDGRTALRLRVSEGLCWITKRGMLSAAVDMELANIGIWVEAGEGDGEEDGPEYEPA